MKVKSESEVAQMRLTLSDPMDCSPPGSPVHGILQARALEWGAIAFSREIVVTEIACALQRLECLLSVSLQKSFLMVD